MLKRLNAPNEENPDFPNPSERLNPDFIFQEGSWSELGQEALPTMTLLNHLEELRRRLIYCLLGFGFMAGLSYWYGEYLLAFLSWPLAKIWMGNGARRFIYTGITEAFLTYIQVALFGGCLFSCPLWAYQLWRFIRPGLYAQERPLYGLGVCIVPFLFVGGAALAYGVICPAAYGFFLSFEMPQYLPIPLEFQPRLSEYVSFMLSLMTTFGVGFQLPLVLVLAVKLGLISLNTLKRHRRYAFLIITVAAAIITPPDILSPLGLMLPVYGLYEGTLAWLTWLEGRR